LVNFIFVSLVFEWLSDPNFSDTRRSSD